MSTKSEYISLREALKGKIGDFLNDEQMPCVHTQDGLVQLISALASYREEGVSLFPKDISV